MCICGRTFKSKQSRAAHYKNCDEHWIEKGMERPKSLLPFQRKDGTKYEKISWNKGLTKETDSRVKTGYERRHITVTSEEYKNTHKHVRHDRITMLSGYEALYRPEHPKAQSNGLVHKHILVAESILGRNLSKEEVVHHIDQNRLNNDPSNLLVFKTKSDHSRFHNKKHPELIKQEDGTFICI